MVFFKSKWLLFFTILAVGWLVISFIKIKLHENIVNIEISNLESKISDLEKSNNVLEKFISYMANPSFLERQARIKLNYKNLGEEVVFVYPDNSAKVGSSSADFRNQLAQMTNIVKWWWYLLGYQASKNLGL